MSLNITDTAKLGKSEIYCLETNTTIAENTPPDLMPMTVHTLFVILSTALLRKGYYLQSTDEE